MERELEKEFSHIKVTRVSSWHDLGSFLDFDPETAKKNIEIGYLDAYKAFDKLDGKLYAFKKGELDRIMDDFGQTLMEECDRVYHHHPAVKLASEVYNRAERKNPKTAQDKFLAVLEGAMEEANLSFAEVYTLETVKEQLLSAQEETFSCGDWRRA